MVRAALPLVAAILLLLPSTTWALGRQEVKKADSILPTACLPCHSSTSPKYPLLGARAGYEVSGHKTLGDASYANGGGCQRCHTNEGFIEYLAGKTQDANSFVRYPSQPGCFTCHRPHETGDMSLRTNAPVKLVNGLIFDVGNGNLCANCHQGREVATKLVVPAPANKVTARFGTHHGPQADIVMGTNAFQFVNHDYGSSAHKDVVNDGCVDCHMALPDGRYGFSPEPGGHSYKVRGMVHESLVLNTAGCIDCHKEIKQVPGRDVFNVLAREDYDRDGKKEPTQDEVQGLLDKLVNGRGTGLLQQLPLPLFKPDGSFNVTSSPAVRPVVELAGLYNYQMILEDGSRGIHNTKYVIQVLYDTIEALDPRFDASRRPR